MKYRFAALGLNSQSDVASCHTASGHPCVTFCIASSALIELLVHLLPVGSVQHKVVLLQKLLWQVTLMVHLDIIIILTVYFP